MALTRELLNALGIEKEKHQAIIDAHTETVEGLKAQAEKYKADAEKLPKVQDELKKAQAAAKDSGEYDKLKKEFDDYKADVASKETLAKKKAALEKLCRSKDGAYLDDNGVAKALKYSDYDKIELDEKDEIKDAKGQIKALREEWPEHIRTTEANVTHAQTPPAGMNADNGNGNRAAQLWAQHRATLYGETVNNTNETKGESK